MRRLWTVLALAGLGLLLVAGLGRAFPRQPEAPDLRTLEAVYQDVERLDEEARLDTLVLLEQRLVEDEAVVFALGRAANGSPRAVVVTFEPDPLTGDWRPVAEHDAPAEGFVAVPVELRSGKGLLAYARLPTGTAVYVGEVRVVAAGAADHGLVRLPGSLVSESDIRLVKGE